MNTNLRQYTRWSQRLFEHRAYSEYLWAYLFLLPFLLVFGAFTVYTLAWGVVISFQDYTAFRAEHRFNGLDNYIRALRDPVLWHSLRVSALYTIATVPVGILWPFFLAVIIQQLYPQLRAFYRSAFYLPGVTSGVVMTLVWVWIFYPMAGGLANGLLSLFGIKPQLWFGDANQALPSLIFMSWLTGWGAAWCFIRRR
jgi:multiple sugar transport system permease protein